MVFFNSKMCEIIKIVKKTKSSFFRKKFRTYRWTHESVWCDLPHHHPQTWSDFVSIVEFLFLRCPNSRGECWSSFSLSLSLFWKKFKISKTSTVFWCYRWWKGARWLLVWRSGVVVGCFIFLLVYFEGACSVEFERWVLEFIGICVSKLNFLEA